MVMRLRQQHLFPRFLSTHVLTRLSMMHDRHDEAHEVLKRLHRTKGDEHDTMARKEYYQMRKQGELCGDHIYDHVLTPFAVDMDRQVRSSTSRFELFKTVPNRRRALVGFVLMWNNQFTGVLIIANYGIILYVALGMYVYLLLNQTDPLT